MPHIRGNFHILEIYRDARRGETVCFDDGRIAGIIEKKNPERLEVRITHTRRPVERLAGHKGVNFPDTRLGLPALGAKDLQDLEFAARHADMVGLSFANRPDDVRDLRKHLRCCGNCSLPRSSARGNEVNPRFATGFHVFNTRSFN